MFHGYTQWMILLAVLLMIGSGPEAVADNSDSRAGHLLLFLEGLHSGGCDLDADGQTGIPDFLLAAEEGFTHCSFNEFLSVNNDPANPLALEMGRPPQVFSVYGVKDSLGNLIQAASMTMSVATGNLLEVDFDIQERPTDLVWGDIVLTAAYTSPTAFTFNGTVGGEVVSGTGDFSLIPEDFLKGLSGVMEKRSYDDATQFCQDTQKILQESIFDLDISYFGYGDADAQSSHLLLSHFLMDEELFPSDNTASCQCLLRAFMVSEGVPREDDRIGQIKGFNLAVTPLMAVHLKMQDLRALCTGHPEVYRCKDVDLDALNKSLGKSIKCISFLALMANSVFLDLAASTPECSGGIHFPDANLEAAVRKALNKLEGEISLSDMEGLTSLQARYKNIQNLEGLQFATNLIDLDLEHNQVNNLGPLANLSKLFTLNLKDNQVSDLSPLHNLNNLDQVVLYGNPLSSLSPLSTLSQMTILNVGNCGLTSLNGIENLTTIRELDIRENEIGSLDALTNLVEIRLLDVRRTGISDLAPLAGMANLLTLYAHGDKILSVPYQNYITSVDPLQGLKKLNYVGLPGNLITDLTGLVNNLDFATNDQLTIYSNPLSENARNVQIPALRARGVSVDY